MQKIILIMILIIMLNSCLDNNQNSDNNGIENAESNSAPIMKMSLANFGSESQIDITNQPNNYTAFSKKVIIRTGDISFEAKDLYKTKQDVDRLLAKYNGYYSSENFSKNDYRDDYNLSVRIPSEKFDLFLKDISSLDGIITSQNISSNDVSSEYLDYEIRLANKSAYLDKYREILKQAKSINEVLEVQDKIRVIEEEIESVKGRLKYLSDQVTLSTININLFKTYDSPIKPNESYLSRMWNSITKGWKGLSEFILIITMLWPFLIITTILFYVVFKITKKFSRKK
ncbi:hypothetical protein MASR1M45_26510 [Candidatus Kapaibacterium sp.]